MPATPSFLCLRDHRIERPKPGAITFTPQLAKRASTIFNNVTYGYEGAVFATGLKIQGDANGFDRLTAPRGAEISAPYYRHIDPHQGTLLLWIRPDWDGDDDTVHTILYDAFDGIHITKTADNTLAFNTDQTARATVDVSGWTAGEKHLLVIRWNAINPINATQHVCITVDATHTFAGTDAWTPQTPAESLHIGSTPLDAPTAHLGPVDGLIEGLTLYRRILYDGTYGTDAGNGDELDLIYNGGDFAKPIPITGREDVVLYVPTDESAGVLSTGTGEAFTFPHHNNKILFIGAEGGTTLTIIDDPLFNQTAYRISDIDAVGDGAKNTYSALFDSAGQNYVISAWIKDDGTHAVDLRIYDQTNAGDITTLSTTGSGQWEHLTTDIDRPAGCNNIEIYTEATDAGSGNIDLLSTRLYLATSGTVAWTDVTLTADPATFTRSMRSGDLRVDGRDLPIQPTNLLTPTYGDLRFHIQLHNDTEYNVSLYRWIYTIYDQTSPNTDDAARFHIIPIPWVIPDFTMEDTTYQETFTENMSADRHAIRIRWTFNEIAVWRNHVLLKRWAVSDHFVAGWDPQIHWGYDGIDDTQQVDGWIGP